VTIAGNFAEAGRRLDTASIGKRIISLGSVGSTNSVAWKEAEEGASHGTVVVAEEQTSGKGRLARRWESPAGLGIWMSVVLRPAVPPSTAPGITICASLAVAKAVRLLYALPVTLKWPNDVMVDERKLCGILTEMKTIRRKVGFVICGIGINVNQSREDFSPELRGSATSVFLSTGTRADRVELFVLVLKELERHYNTFLESGLPTLVKDWRTMCPLFGRIVRVKTRDEEVEGVFFDIEPSGALVLRLDSGVQRSFLAGDVEPVS